MGKKAKADTRQTRKIQEQLQVRTGALAEVHMETGLGQCRQLEGQNRVDLKSCRKVGQQGSNARHGTNVH